MADVKFQGSGTETINSNGTVTLSIPEILNELKGQSGNVRLELWATTSAYVPGGPGTLIATDSLGQLTGGETLAAFGATLNLSNMPTVGTYNLTLVLTEATGVSTDGGYAPQAYIPFSPPTPLYPIHFDTSSGASKWTMNFGTDTATINVPQIDNNSGVATGTLRVELWATTAVYHGGALSGTLLAEQQVSSISASGTDAAAALSLNMTSPATGTPFYTALVLTEYTGASSFDDGYVVESYQTNSNTIILTAPLTVQLATAQFSAGSSTTQIAVSDSAANVAVGLDSLQSIAAANELTTITLTDGGVPTLTVTAAQFISDTTALKDISSPHAVIVEMTGNAAQHNFSGETWTGATALQFADQTVFVAATPGPANAVTTGNITELYSAVLAREPDVGGLAFYQNFLKSNPSTALQTFAEFFLSSTEYKAAHSYAQTTQGDEQFITDSYQNLLGRTPDASEVSFYETNVLAKAVANLTPGTTAYSDAQLQAHALMLVYFSASAEFLSGVQITAQTPASAQHWLLLT